MLPVTVPAGSIRIVYSPDAGKLKVGKLKVAAEVLVEINVVPSGATRLAVTEPKVLEVNCTVACCPPIALKVTFAFCPGTVVVTVMPLPEVIGVNTFVESFTVKPTLPVKPPSGTTWISYVPEAGKT